MKLIECVPNFSEGRDPAVIESIRTAIAGIRGVSVLHVTSDASHNRSVITFVAPYDVMADAAFAAIRAAREHIDLTKHAGVHPRIGAADVVPFIPLDGATIDDCVALAHAVGERVGRELDIPVYLYERAATRATRRNLADVRRGGFEGLHTAIVEDPERVPDYGPPRMHPTFGAVAIGARPFLVAYNVYLGDKSNLPIAKAVARSVRESSGGLPAVKALGLEVDGQAQVSMNLVDIDKTPLSVAFDAVRVEAAAHGALVTWSEIIGLVPEQVMFEAAGKYLRLRQPIDTHVLERAILAARTETGDLSAYVEAVADDSPTPGGGSVAAYVGSLAAALARMVAGLTRSRPKFASVHETMEEVLDRGRQLSELLITLAARDADAYATVVDAYRRPHTTDAEKTAREQAIRTALLHAALVPTETAARCVEVASLAEMVARAGNPNAITDAGTAAALAEAACQSASYNVRVNLRDLADSDEAADMLATVRQALETTRQGAARVAELVEQALPPL